MPMASTSSSEGQRRSCRQRIDLSLAEEGFDRHELERAMRESLNEANKHGIIPSPDEAEGGTAKKQKKSPGQKKAVATAKRKIGKKEAKRLAARKGSARKIVQKKVEVKKVELKKTAENIDEKAKKMTNEVKKTVTKKGTKTEGNKKVKISKASEFIAMLACAKSVLSDH